MTSSDDWDTPSTGPFTRVPFEQLLHELAERTGRPIFNVRYSSREGVKQTTNRSRILSDDDVRGLRAAARRGASPAALAVRFGVVEAHVRRILDGSQRPHVPGEEPAA